MTKFDKQNFFYDFYFIEVHEKITLKYTKNKRLMNLQKKKYKIIFTILTVRRVFI